MNRIYFKPVDDGVDSIDDVDIRVYLSLIYFQSTRYIDFKGTLSYS